jgi:hypothetical protein
MSIGGFGPEGIVIDGQRPSKKLEAIGQIPLLITETVDGTPTTVWRPSVLLNSIEETGPAWGIYTSEVTVSRIGATFWTNRYPSGSPTDNAMPRANVSQMWGDFHLLGDIIWLADQNVAFGPDNAARFPHAIWFSQPEKADSWDPVDVQFIGQQADDNVILGMFPVTAGLIVISTNGAHMLRGNPDFNEYEQVRVGIGPASRKSVTFWPAAGVVVWVDKRGQIWQTNGENFGRLDTVLPDVDGPCPSSIVAFDDFLIVSRNGRMYALRLYQGQGIWTELNATCMREMHRYEGSIYMARTFLDGIERFAPEFGRERHAGKCSDRVADHHPYVAASRPAQADVLAQVRFSYGRVWQPAACPHPQRTADRADVEDDRISDRRDGRQPAERRVPSARAFQGSFVYVGG